MRKEKMFSRKDRDNAIKIAVKINTKLILSAIEKEEAEKKADWKFSKERLIGEKWAQTVRVGNLVRRAINPEKYGSPEEKRVAEVK